MPEVESEAEALRKLIDGLIAATRNGKVKWRTGYQDDAFEVERKAGVAMIRTRDADGAPPFVFELRSPGGYVLESLWSLDPEAGVTEWLEPLRALYSVAKRSALDVTTIARQFLDQLADDEEPF